MNLFIVRTRLQSLIAQKINEECVPGQSYGVVFLYQHHTREDSENVYRHYEFLKRHSVIIRDVVSADGLFKNVLSILPLFIKCALTGGSLYFASTDSVAIAITLRLFGFVNINTFDDGAFNLLPQSRLYGRGPVIANGLKGRIYKFIFPIGSTEWLRSKILKHYTIFKSSQNIVSASRLHLLEWDWRQYLDHSDLAKLGGRKVRTIVIGTPHDEFPDPAESMALARCLATHADLYLRHPREQRWLMVDNELELVSPAESALLFLADQEILTVYHFNSTVAYSLANTANIKFVNLIDPNTRILRFQSSNYAELLVYSA